MWFGLASTFSVVIIGDLALGLETVKQEYKYKNLLNIPLYLSLPLLIISLVLFAWSIGNPEIQRITTLSDYIGGALSVGFLVAGYGTNVGHELTHRIQNKWALSVGRWLLSMSWNADFSIEHVYGHHANVGRRIDPATARKGENVYAFFIRSTIYSHISAWNIEKKHLGKKGLSVISVHNKMFRGYLMSIFWMILFAAFGGLLGVALFLVQALFAKFMLEIVNYIEHYGLVRDKKQRVQPYHSWNTNNRMSGIVLFSLNRHSAHHAHGSKPFWELDLCEDAPQLPYGYLVSMLISLCPPLWYKIVDNKVSDWGEKYAEFVPNSSEPGKNQ